jgi:cyclase
VIPTVLTNGNNVVKGTKFNNWRTVGNAEATARLYAKRDVDELMFLDVVARSLNTTINRDLIETFSRVLDVPFTVGGGINSLDDAKMCFRYGAEKIVLGTSAVLTPDLISEVANTFGSQAVIVSIDLMNDSLNQLSYFSGKELLSISVIEFISKCESLGAGEILLQSVSRDGTMEGFDLNSIKAVSSCTKLPVIASSGASIPNDFVLAVEAGASAVAAGALFQFTENTPRLIRNYMQNQGIKVRVLTQE